ncbi:MAG: RDD family protein [Solirubrobacteraceae bacterium]
MSSANEAKPPGARVLAAGAKGAERVARAAGVDRLLNEAAEEAIVRALESPAVMRAIERVLESDALAAELDSEELRQVVKRALESDAAEAVWSEVLESEQVQMLIERIANAPELRAAIRAQGAGLITDVGVRLTIVTERLDDAMERIVRPRDAESETDQAGLATRAVAAGIDLALLFASYSLLSGVFASLIADIFGKPLGLVSVIVLAAVGVIVAGAIFAAFWDLAGQTPGMRFLAIRIYYHDGSRHITFGRAAWRVLAVILSLLPLGLGYWAILRDPQRRAWSDRMTGTKVCYDSVARAAARERAGSALHDAARDRPRGA